MVAGFGGLNIGEEIVRHGTLPLAHRRSLPAVNVGFLRPVSQPGQLFIALGHLHGHARHREESQVVIVIWLNLHFCHHISAAKDRVNGVQCQIVQGGI